MTEFTFVKFVHNGRDRLVLVQEYMNILFLGTEILINLDGKDVV